jgi:hypothetical protein
MWRRSFVATTVALGGTIDDALGALSPDEQHGVQLDDIVARLRAPTRPARATALAEAVGDIIVAIDRTTLR